ncbi:MAG: S-layer homology domain-containing protein [Clostridia bacterium]|nr:S-layer homology domain-containing protein [Clostridia bacterium]
MRKKITAVIAGAVCAVMLAGTALAADLPFTDVPGDAWYTEDVTYAYENGLFSGTTEDTFSPDNYMTRGMFVTVLKRQTDNMGMSTEVSSAAGFNDVASTAYYYDAVNWAAANGIVTGKDAATFAPNENVTREQMCAIIVRYMRDYLKLDLSQYEGDVSFADAADISSYAASAVAIAQNAGIVNGYDLNGEPVFNPRGNATRAAVAKVIHIESQVVAALNGTASEDTNNTDTENNTDNNDNNDNNDNTDKTDAKDNSGSSSGGGGGGGSDEPSNAPTAEDIAQEKVIADYLQQIVNKYPRLASTDDTAYACLGKLVETLQAALDAHNNGVFLDRAYIDLHYGAQMANVKAEYRSMTEDQQGAFKNMGARLATTEVLETLFDYFGFSTAAIS